ncbi:MAG: ParB/RepB/Spo0J family partition protein [Nitrospira sp.]
MKPKSRDREPVDIGDSLPDAHYQSLSPVANDRRREEEAKSMRNVFGAGTNERITEVSLDRVDASPYQPRIGIDEEALNELKESIRERGVINPILVRTTTNGRYELIAGARRAEASRALGRATIPAIVRNYSDQDAEYLALIDNIHRQDLGVLEQARSFARLIDRHSLTHEDLAKQLKCSRARITRMLKVLDLSQEVQDLLYAPGHEFGALHGELLASVKSSEKCLRLAQRVVQEKWSTRRLEEEINRKPRVHKGYESVVYEERPDGFNLRISFRDNHEYDIARSEQAIRKALARLSQTKTVDGHREIAYTIEPSEVG